MLVGALSSKNPRVKELRRLVSQRKARSQERAFVAEGPVLVAEALRSDLEVRCVYSETENDVVDLAESLGVEVQFVVDGGLSSVLSTVSPQPVAAIVVTPEWVWSELIAEASVLVLDDVRDPGNVGTLIRTAEAAGCGGVVLVGDCVDPTSPKVVRASAGAVFRLPVVVEPDRSIAFRQLRDDGHSCLATVLSPDAANYDRADLTTAALVLGNEAAGLDPSTVAACDGLITIPLAGPTESLNVASAGAVVCFESLRQRRNRIDS